MRPFDLFLSCALGAGLLAGAATAQVVSHVKIAEGQGGFTGDLTPGDEFGSAVTWIGDVDGDGVEDLAVGAAATDGVALEVGVVWILFMNPDGTVRDQRRISPTNVDFEESFGRSLARLDDLDGDGVPDLAVGVPRDDDGGTGNPHWSSNCGAVWITFLNADGSVKATQRISQTEGGLTAPLPNHGYFGMSVTPLGDLDGDGVVDLAVGRTGPTFGPVSPGVLYVLFLNADGTVKAHTEYEATMLPQRSQLAFDLANVGDVDGDGVVDVVAGVFDRSDLGQETGSLVVLFLNADGTVHAHQEISNSQGGFTACFDNSNHAGTGLASLGDLDGDGVAEVAAGAPWFPGAIWQLYLRPDGSVKGHLRIAQGEGGFDGEIEGDDIFGGDRFGWRLDAVDLDGDGNRDLAAGAPGDDPAGAVWVLFLEPAPPRASGVRLGTVYCDPNRVNSTGLAGELRIEGSATVADDFLTLKAVHVPSALGIFIMGTGTDLFIPPGSVGAICVTPGMRRFFEFPRIGGGDGFCASVGTRSPTSSQIAAGSTWNFQAWFRDGMVSNFTHAVSVQFQ